MACFITPGVGQPHAVRRQHAGQWMDHDPGHSERIRHQTGVLPPRSAEASQRVARHVIAARHRHLFDGVRHVIDRDRQEPLGNRDGIEAPAGRRGHLVGQREEFLVYRRRIERLVAARRRTPRGRSPAEAFPS